MNKNNGGGEEDRDPDVLFGGRKRRTRLNQGRGSRRAGQKKID